MRNFDYRIFRGKTVLATDLDMSVVDNSERRRQAEARGRVQGTQVDYAFFFDEENLSLDQTMPEQLVLLWRALNVGLVNEGVYLSSRPDTLWYASATWLYQHGYPFPFHLLLRGQYQLTEDFKREELQRIAEYASLVLFVDDSPKTRAAVTGLPSVLVFERIESVFQLSPSAISGPLLAPSSTQGVDEK